jgi:ppGpp synthetase/RelA/SpoT-type nucleotidyltranferase
MPVIDDFMSQYLMQFDFYQEAARICAQKCDTALQQNGIRAIVTFRAKSLYKLRLKLNSRDIEKKYATVREIRDDIPDLAGVRIALYFPGDAIETDRLLQSLFNVQKVKNFPQDSPSSRYIKRFTGYGARHYRINLLADSLSGQTRFSNALIEIQVASVLMHAWAEVEHDLVYKPLSGSLSDDEYAILDELNGMVLAGEISLERLQNAARQRISKSDLRFNNHYELAAYIYDTIIKAL